MPESLPSEPSVHVEQSVDCFNQVWKLLQRDSRRPEQDRLMLAMAHASLYHWLRRPDCNPRNVSIGQWQVSRVASVLGRSSEAVAYAADCLKTSKEANLDSFCVAYAHEATSRAHLLGGLLETASLHLNLARKLLDSIASQEDRALLFADLEELDRKINQR